MCTNKDLHNLKQFNYVQTNDQYLIELQPSRLIGLVASVFANGLGDLCSIPGRVIPKTLKTVLDTSLLNTQFKERITCKVKQSRGKSSAPYTSV